MAASSSNENSKKMIALTSSDGQCFKAEESVICASETIKNIVEDSCFEDGIPLHNVTGPILAKVLEYCKKHAEAEAEAEDDAAAASATASSSSAVVVNNNDVEASLKKWDSEFMEVDQATVYDLMMAANYLNINGLLHLTAEKVADMIKGKTPEQIRRTFGIVNDFTPEQEKAVRMENEWAFDSDYDTE